MNWYEKLNQYFPVEEMKSQEHMETLLKEKGNVYYKDEGPYHVLMFAEFSNFSFVDYLFVSKESRGMGIGKKTLQMLKDKNKPIILEVEPVNYEDTDTEKRLRFYAREGFEHANSIGYCRRSVATGEENSMEILYWAPNGETEEDIYEAMKKTYKDIHSYKNEEHYGEAHEPVSKVLTLNEVDKEDVLEPFAIEVKN
ncbi:GNAT family N-acetyltransferase [Planococcus sp. N028]|uniref:GNAT family N-acetyltransferase n=1 Tax=Planococcus shixiaomingii TaxID=3058393 RepID=A0ABT8N6Y4_9BACL|nr:MULTISPECIES: GNAT family N-acetyltransferase [unclassified Planococcus (in: firmicutes)]MDN7243644.1 GNAT family N-acetyltransferase [Planococcus sp. N028]WKA55782.1 GNAT family N-acetyltransferase [Planococcus sp. N022]